MFVSKNKMKNTSLVILGLRVGFQLLPAPGDFLSYTRFYALEHECLFLKMIKWLKCAKQPFVFIKLSIYFSNLVNCHTFSVEPHIIIESFF